MPTLQKPFCVSHSRSHALIEKCSILIFAFIYAPLVFHSNNHLLLVVCMWEEAWLASCLIVSATIVIWTFGKLIHKKERKSALHAPAVAKSRFSFLSLLNTWRFSLPYLWSQIQVVITGRWKRHSIGDFTVRSARMDSHPGTDATTAISWSTRYPLLYLEEVLNRWCFFISNQTIHSTIIWLYSQACCVISASTSIPCKVNSANSTDQRLKHHWVSSFLYSSFIFNFFSMNSKFWRNDRIQFLTGSLMCLCK